MSLPEKVHAQAGLADTAADGAGEFPGEEAAVEIEVRLPFLSSFLQLPAHGLGIDPDAHRGNLEGALQDGVPQEDVAIQAGETVAVRGAPVVVVRGAAVMDASVRQLSADADDENGLVLPAAAARHG